MNKYFMGGDGVIIETQEFISGYQQDHVFIFLRKDVDSLSMVHITEAKMKKIVGSESSPLGWNRFEFPLNSLKIHQRYRQGSIDLYPTTKHIY